MHGGKSNNGNDKNKSQTFCGKWRSTISRRASDKRFVWGTRAVNARTHPLAAFSIGAVPKADGAACGGNRPASERVNTPH